MRIFPHALEKTQSLYSVIPLALDLDKMHSYFPHLKSSFGDCQFFSAQELPCAYFSYQGTQYSILNVDKNQQKKPRASSKINQVPFTTLLVGPVYACREVLTSFNSWAVLDSDAIMIPPIKTPLINNENENKNTTVNKKTKEHKKNICWLPVQHPSVWAQATFTTVTVTTAYPKSLEHTLQTLFQFPISVSAIPPVSTENHNEFAAWLGSIYALVASRNVYRYVFCHSHMWKNQLQFFSNVYNSSTPDIPETWKRLARIPTISVPSLNILSTNTSNTGNSNAANSKTSSKTNSKTSSKNIKQPTLKNNSPVVEYAKKISHYNIRKQTYKNKDSFLCRSIGMGIIQTPIISQKAYDNIIKQNDISIQMEYDKTQATITIPLLLSEEIMTSMKELVSQQIGIPIQRVSIELSQNKAQNKTPNEENFIENSSSYYSILMNLVIHICKKIVAKKKQPSQKQPPQKKRLQKKLIQKASLSQCKFLCKQLVNSCVVMEFDINKYGRDIILNRAFIVCDAGYITNENRSYGIAEKHFFHSFFSLCGNHNTVSKTFECTIEFFNSTRCVYASSFSNNIKNAVYNAMFDGLDVEHTRIHFPRKVFDDTARTI